MARDLTATAQPDPEAIRASYGFVGKLADSVPEIQAVLAQAVNEKWTTDRFLMSVANTDWYKTSSARARDWVMKSSTDPAQANEDLLIATDKVNMLAGHLGITLNADQARDVALHDIMHGLTPEQLSAHMARNYFSGYQDWNKLGGKAAETSRQIQELGYQYGYRDWDNYSQSRDWLGRIMTGQDDINGFHNMLKTYAKSKYPGFYNEIESGMTVRDIAKPYVESQAKLLEIPHTSIDITNDNLLNRAMQARNDQGAPAPMSLTDYESQVRNDPRWATTHNAMDSSAKAATQIGKMFGMVG